MSTVSITASKPSKREAFLLAFFSVVLLVGTSASYFYHSQHMQVACSIFFSTIIGVSLHEWGHALGAFLVGGTVHFIQLGQRYKGNKPWKLRLLGFTWHIYSLPLSGSVHASFYDAHLYRLRRCLMIVFGPFVNLLLLVPGLILINFANLDQNSGFLLGWFFANGFILLVSIPPMTINHYGKSQGNDGLLFWQSLRYTDQEIKGFVQHAELSRSWGKDSDIAQSLTLEELLEKHDADKTNPVFLWHLFAKAQELKDPKSLDYLLQLMDMAVIPKKSLAPFIDTYLTAQLEISQQTNPDMIDKLSLQLVDQDNSVSARGTRGSVMIDLGRIDEGIAMLKEVLEKTDSTIDKTYANIFLALAEKQQGNLALARDYAEKAAKFDPACPALKRVLIFCRRRQARACLILRQAQDDG